MRINKIQLGQAVNRYATALMSLEIKPPVGTHLEFLEGSKANGVSFKLVYVDNKHGGTTHAPGADFGGHVGMTRREAWETINNMARTLEDVAFYNHKKAQN